MPNQELLKEFYDLLDESPNFKHLSNKEQDRIKSKYAKAQDEEIIRGIEIVKNDTEKTKKEIERLVKEKSEAEIQKRRHAKEMMKEHILIEQAESEAKSREILSELMAVDNSNMKEAKSENENSHEKRKKFFGLF